MTERKAHSLQVLLDQINKEFPDRSKKSDGWIGDRAHSARKSDHNPDKNGVVHAIDITHDPANGLDSEALANALLASRDARIKYIISNKKIVSGQDGPSPWEWRTYTGSNPHNKHVHISVRDANGDDKKAWQFTLSQAIGEPLKDHPLLMEGSRGEDVKILQRLLQIVDDGVFGPKTKVAVIEFQKRNGLVPDGVVGEYTWEKLEK